MSSNGSSRLDPALLLFLATAMLAACGSPNPAYHEAVNSYIAAMQDPAVLSAAPGRLQYARVLLDSAKNAQSAGASEAEVTHRAYLASREVAMAREQANFQQAAQAAQQANAARQRQTVMRLDNVLFRTNEATLAPGARPVLDRLARALEDHPDQIVRIEGYTDSRGSDQHNTDLSRRRADAVRAALISRGIDQRRITTHGNGDASPIADNDTAEGRQMNRRVEVVMSSAGASQPVGGSTSPPPAPGTSGAATQ